MLDYDGKLYVDLILGHVDQWWWCMSWVEYAEDTVIQLKTFFQFPPKARTEELPARVTVLNNIYGSQQSSFLVSAGQELLGLGDRMV